MARDICSVIVVCELFEPKGFAGVVGILNSFGLRDTLWVDIYHGQGQGTPRKARELLFCRLDTSESSIQPPEEQARLELEVFKSDPIRWVVENADRSWIKI